ncbi:hypothetical protein [Hymenobacter edaphi]|uniref:Uncharacterized protein n=1 Tax=Hymenobacter edaphi TaxID=2211146 RepID=A0A328BSI1_9BACT|nr:hypothetical protein [Hymenobacter edaphi]RAK70003.1 hypothetical protein DLM85_03890 [Hymenobacter edaphi]
MIKPVFSCAILATILTGCGGTNRLTVSGPPAEVQLRPAADSAFNLVWLRITIRNTSRRPLWLLNAADSITVPCGAYSSFQLIGRTPAGRELFLCPCVQPSRARFKPVLRSCRLAPGQQLRTAVRLDFNQVFPRTGSPADTTCARFVNRTTGAYTFRLVTRLLTKPNGYYLQADTSQTVTVYRKN